MFASQLVLVAALVSSASAALTVLTPNANTWWVAQSENVFSWSCSDSPSQTFTVLIGNQDNKILTQPQAVIAIQNNADCSKAITQQQANFTAASGYFLQLANPLNQTDVFAQSEPFEVRPLGAAYPATTSVASPNTASGSASGSAAPAQATQPGNNGAASLKVSAAALVGIVVGYAFLA
ncbi:hypothetical protein BDN71DRAFT_1452405 [Pleurotus eryngii]|uniref:Yeast cell wall synthesis Kre9/Knh1-like N-terminal domain-containing protein n=1 Tax=Pleurotus eryngii TaxID=5323 RepID=A0A9P5ZQA4_PLEER|nr:hypothetical protein BDN71DRAFT_1452405 [Pleurotus eryngii]